MFAVLITTVLGLCSTLAVAGPVAPRTTYSDDYAGLVAQYCNNASGDGSYHCFYVNDNFRSDSLSDAAGDLQAHHPDDAITVYVLKDGAQSSIFLGYCDNDINRPSTLYFTLNSLRGSSLLLQEGEVTGYWKSEVSIKLVANAQIDSHTPGDDAVLYCQVE